MTFDKWFEQNYSHIQAATLKLAIREATNKAYDYGWNAACDKCEGIARTMLSIYEGKK